MGGGRTEDRPLGGSNGVMPQALEPQRPRRLIGIASPRSLVTRDAASLGTRVCLLYDRTVESRSGIRSIVREEVAGEAKTRLVIFSSAGLHLAMQGPEPSYYRVTGPKPPMATAAMRTSGEEEMVGCRDSSVGFF